MSGSDPHNCNSPVRAGGKLDTGPFLARMRRFAPNFAKIRDADGHSPHSLRDRTDNARRHARARVRSSMSPAGSGITKPCLTRSLAGRRLGAMFCSAWSAAPKPGRGGASSRRGRASRGCSGVARTKGTRLAPGQFAKALKIGWASVYRVLNQKAAN